MAAKRGKGCGARRGAAERTQRASLSPPGPRVTGVPGVAAPRGGARSAACAPRRRARSRSLAPGVCGCDGPAPSDPSRRRGVPRGVEPAARVSCGSSSSNSEPELNICSATSCHLGARGARCSGARRAAAALALQQPCAAVLKQARAACEAGRRAKEASRWARSSGHARRRGATASRARQAPAACVAAGGMHARRACCAAFAQPQPRTPFCQPQAGHNTPTRVRSVAARLTPPPPPRGAAPAPADAACAPPPRRRRRAPAAAPAPRAAPPQRPGTR